MLEVLLSTLLRQALVLTLTVAIVLVLGAVVSSRFGATAVYRFWFVVPATLVAVELPHRGVVATVVHLPLAHLVARWQPEAPMAPVGALPSAAGAALITWASIACLLVLAVVWRQWQFQRLLGRSSCEGVERLPAGCGPAVIGLLRSRVVLPLDFETRFDAHERRLMLV